VRSNWTLALLTIPRRCSRCRLLLPAGAEHRGVHRRTCARQGQASSCYGLIMYGTPVIAVVAVALSFVTASSRDGSSCRSSLGVVGDRGGHPRHDIQT